MLSSNPPLDSDVANAAPIDTGVPALTKRKKRASSTTRRRKTTREFLCRLDVCWTFFFFLFLVCVSVITTAITQARISQALLLNLRDTHDLHIATMSRKIDLGTERIFNMSAGFLSLHSQRAFQLSSESTLSTLCSILASYDMSFDFRSLSLNSFELKEAVSCFHGDPQLGSVRQLYGWITENSVIPGVYLINSTTLRFEQPLKPVYGGWPQSVYNLSGKISLAFLNSKLIQQIIAYFNGSIKYIDYRTMWRVFPAIPHIIYCTIPAGFLFRGLNLPPNINVTDYVNVRVNGAGLLTAHTSASLTNITAAIFINASLTDKDPLVMSNNWGQPSVNDTEILTTYEEGQVKYLPVSNISDPLMRAALKHVSLKALQAEGYNRTVDFQYRGAPARVTAATLTTTRGLVLPMVFVSSNAAIAMPYRRIMNICNGVTAVVIVAFTALFWWFVHRYLHQPLQRMTRRMLHNLRVGHREHTREPPFQLFHLTETRALLQAHRDTVTRLREIDAFVPRDVQEQMALGVRSTASATAHGAALLPPDAGAAGALLQQPATLVYVTLRPCDHVAAPMRSPSTLAALAAQPHTPQRLADVVARAARAAELVNSGPFPTPAALEGFVAALHELCEEQGGVVHRLTPDSCVLHFSKAVRAHMTRCGGGAAAELRACAARDAQRAMRFAFALLRWVDRYDAPNMPDVRVLADSGLFVCGQYRPRGSEQTLSVALGRDMQRKLGHVPASIGVRVAMTEETACLVRGAVRQIPVESFHIGRASLNANVVILFEALPGRTGGDEAWRLFSCCCHNGFSCMVRGNYAEALRTYVSIASIADLEPGLMPASLRREAARSDVTGGAESVQVERLMKECLHRVRAGDTRCFCRERYVPLGIDTVLHRVTPAGVIPETMGFHAVFRGSGAANADRVTSHQHACLLRGTAACERWVVDLYDGRETTRSVIATPPQWLMDNYGLLWQLAARPLKLAPRPLWHSRFLGLGSAGAVATFNAVALRNPPSIVANAIRDAPVGPMSDELRSATPVFCATPQQEKAVRALLQKQAQLQHASLLTPIGYCVSAEGTVVFVWQLNSGGTLRQVLARYVRLKPITLFRFMYDVLSGLMYLHERGIAHASLNLDNVIVGASGACYLNSHSADRASANRLFVLPRPPYMSPAMAAGAMPTPACDMFCYGLMCIELLSGAKAWKWAAAAGAVAEEGQQQQQQQQQQPVRSEEELGALMADAGQPFYDAVADGRIVPNTDVLDTFDADDRISDASRQVLLDCLALEPSKRPSAAQVRAFVRLKLDKAGLTVNQKSGDES